MPFSRKSHLRILPKLSLAVSFLFLIFFLGASQAQAGAIDVPALGGYNDSAQLLNGGPVAPKSVSYAPGTDSNGDYVLATVDYASPNNPGVNAVSIYEVNPATGAQAYMAGIPNQNAVGDAYYAQVISFAPAKNASGNWVLAVSSSVGTTVQLELFTVNPSSDAISYVSGSNTTYGNVAGDTSSPTSLALSLIHI